MLACSLPDGEWRVAVELPARSPRNGPFRRGRVNVCAGHAHASRRASQGGEPGAAMEVTLIRHAQPHWEPDGAAVDEPTLTEYGFRQAERTAEHLANEKFDALYVSPLRRARETAEPIARALGLEPVALSWLRELTLPSLEGSTPERVQDFFRNHRLNEPEKWWDGFEGGESFRHFYERVSGGLDALLTGDHAMDIHEDTGHRLWKVPNWDARIAIVAHEGTNSICVAHLLGIPPNPWTALRFAVAWTGISRLQTAMLGDGAVWTLEGFNRVEHLVGLEGPGDGRAPRRVT